MGWRFADAWRTLSLQHLVFFGAAMGWGKERRTPRWMIFGWVLAGLGSFGALAAMINTSFRKLLSGNGLDTFRTVWQVEFSHMGFLILIVSVPVALAIAGVLRFVENREMRALERKYSGGNEADAAPERSA